MLRRFSAGEPAMRKLVEAGLQVWEYTERTCKWLKDWSFAQEAHWFWEVTETINEVGSYWVPTSTNPPSWWPSPQELTDSEGKPLSVPGYGKAYRPSGIYIWIPEATFQALPHLKFEDNPRGVTCHAPLQYPPVLQDQQSPTTATTARALLDEVLASPPDQKAFQDSDGLISFVNLSSSFVTSNSEFKTGREICDKVSNFFATLREPVFSFLLKDPSKVLKGDTAPTTKWDTAVTHYMQYLLTQAGGLTNFQVVSEFYSNTQIIAEFSTEFIKLLFDAATVPTGIIGSVVSFIQGVGQSLRGSWDDRSRNYQTAILGQCHEAIPVDKTGETFIYYPKIKYYYLSVDSSQQAFTSDCATVRKITFDFRYESYVTGLKAAVLDNTSADYERFVEFLDQAQGTSYTDAKNNLESILNQIPSLPPSKSEIDLFGVDLQAYPRVSLKPATNAPNGASTSIELKAIEEMLNTRVV